jgi:chromosome segregation ATPase
MTLTLATSRTAAAAPETTIGRYEHLMIGSASVKAKTATLDQMDALKKEVSKQEDATAKAEKKYNNSMKDGEEYKGDLNKAESKIGEAQIEMDKVKTELQNENNKLAELRAQLAAL